MNPFHEYALLVVVVIPVLALVGLNVFLWAGGERGTLLLPSKRHPFASGPVSDAAGVPTASVVDETPEATGKQAARAPANDPHAREAA
jgi:hypothetical protein